MNPDTPKNNSIPVAPSLQATLSRQHVRTPVGALPRRQLIVIAYALLVALLASGAAELLTALIGLISNLLFYGEWNVHYRLPAGHNLGGWVVALPVIGGVVVGLMARYGSQGIRGHGIPEAMEKVLTGESRIPARLTVLKPLSAAISIGTGGPFGAEGPIIATGGALGSLLGQLVAVTATERKVILAAGAAAGMTAIFGTPVAAVLLAVELLLFEYHPRSFLPVSAAVALAAAMRFALHGAAPFFALADLPVVSAGAIAGYAVLGGVVGILGVGVTKAVYSVEDLFEKLPIHWMWWPAIGGLAVGLVGVWSPRTLGVGYENITDVMAGGLPLGFVIFLGATKFLSWVIALGSGTSGGTLAPLLTIGGAAGAALGVVAQQFVPALGVDPRVCALVGMATMFGASSRAFLASLMFAFESTLQVHSLLPLLAGSVTAYAVSAMLMRNTIMTEKIVRRGVHVPNEYVSDFLAYATVGAYASKPVTTLDGERSAESVAAWLDSGEPGAGHQGFPVVDAAGNLLGVVTRRNFRGELTGKSVAEMIAKKPVVVGEGESLRDAANAMIRHALGRLPVVDRGGKVIGMITRSDLLAAQTRKLDESESVRIVRKLPLGLRLRKE
jgi:H+/Cl- antiporter ClcA